MEITIEFNDLVLLANAEKSHSTQQGYLLYGSDISIALPYQVNQYFRHGWQSWSLTTWVESSRCIPLLKPNVLHPMQTDPGYVCLERQNGSWLGAIDAPGGNVLLLGALGLEAHVELEGRILRGRYETGSGNWFITHGKEHSVFTHYAELLEKLFGRGRVAKRPRIWCSWYSLYTQISEVNLLDILKDLRDIPFDVFQIDDGWQQRIGEWEPNKKFPSGMDNIAAQIRFSGRIPGLWLAPFLVAPSSSIPHKHPDWLLRDDEERFVSAGFNWGEPNYALDITHPEVLEWLITLINNIRAWGYDYLKLDFLYAGALPGKRHNGLPREAGYRYGLKVLREAMGDAYFMACGAPILPTLGLCDGMRVGPDVASYWDSFRNSHLLNNPSAPGVQNAIRTTVNRLWLNPLVHIDPDVVYFRSHNNDLLPVQKRILQDLALVTGFKASSDPPSWLSTEEKQALGKFLEQDPKVKRTGRYTFLIGNNPVDFSFAMPLPDPPNFPLRGIGSFLGWLANMHWVLRINDWLGRIMVANAIRTTQRKCTKISKGTI